MKVRTSRENEQVWVEVPCVPSGKLTITSQRIIRQHRWRDESSCEDIWLGGLLEVQYVSAIGSPGLELRHRLPDGTEKTDVVNFPSGLGGSLGFKLSSGYSPKQLGHLISLMLEMPGENEKELPNQDVEAQIDKLRRKTAKYRGAFWMAGIFTLVQGLVNLVADCVLGKTEPVAFISEVGANRGLFETLMLGSALVMIWLVLPLVIYAAISAVLIYYIADESECEEQAAVRWGAAGIVYALLLQWVFWVGDRFTQDGLACWLSLAIRIGVGVLVYYSVFKLLSLFRGDGDIETA
ncbi:MAG: hypothetical protein JXA33_28285 [Anaerolineae bacterium]|nr:hypothetical protein [Anaerolineae bacterium]